LLDVAGAQQFADHCVPAQWKFSDGLTVLVYCMELMSCSVGATTRHMRLMG
jgi:hypothetical protein